jgi:hypothetical protein
LRDPDYQYPVGRESEAHPASAPEQTEIMPQSIRAFVPGGAFFFAVTLLERCRNLLTEHIEDLRAVFKAARQRRPFFIEAIVINPVKYKRRDALRFPALQKP